MKTKTKKISIKVIFTALDENQVEYNFTLDAPNLLEAEIIAKDFLGREYAGGIIVLAQTWDLTNNKIVNEFEF